MTITTRAGKGSELSHAELDENFTDLRDGVALQTPKAKGAGGIKVDSEGSPTYPWHDVLGVLQVYGEVGDASRAAFRGGIKALQFDENDSSYVDFHFPHDYVPNSDIYVHIHWSHGGALVTGGSVTWGVEFTYAKGHNQAAFPNTATLSVVSSAPTTAYQHMINEVQGSSAGGSASTVDRAELEADGVGMARIYLDSNDILVSGGSKPAPFVHYVDLHYQSTGVGTKNKEPDFWA